MANDSTLFDAPSHQIGIPRQRQPGVEVWRLEQDGHLHTCEIRDDNGEDAGWDLMVLEDGEPLFSQRCGDEQYAYYVAETFKQDSLRTGSPAV